MYLKTALELYKNNRLEIYFDQKATSLWMLEPGSIHYRECMSMYDSPDSLQVYIDRGYKFRINSGVSRNIFLSLLCNYNNYRINHDSFKMRVFHKTTYNEIRESFDLDPDKEIFFIYALTKHPDISYITYIKNIKIIRKKFYGNDFGSIIINMSRKDLTHKNLNFLKLKFPTIVKRTYSFCYEDLETDEKLFQLFDNLKIIRPNVLDIDIINE